MEDLLPAERQVWLEQRCQGDPKLLESVELFLGHETRLQGFLEDTAAEHLQIGAFNPEWQGESGPRIGPYRVLGLLGRGGMGAVYEAVREDDFEQRVALKLVLAGRNHPRTLQLFQNERQILARLEHPNIARLLDGGADQQGRPYFAMELIEGEPIDSYCDRNRLSVFQRLELVLHLCDALQKAHRNLVVHRDIKPGNVLVDATGAPKLLDFGIAKLIEPEATLATQSGSQPMTLFYASPEQLRNEPITPASDLYSLGVVLYRLLTGVLPNDLEKLGYLKLALAVCDQDPQRPSDVLAGFSPDQLEQVAHQRALDPARLRRQLAGDVDAILLKTLRKEPDRRYSSVEQLAADIRRFLDGRPVLARNGNWTYRAGKFARRNRWPLAIGSVALSVILTLSTLFVLQAREVEKERDRALFVKSFLTDLFIEAAPYEAESHEDLEAWNRVLWKGYHLLNADTDIVDEDRADLMRTMAGTFYHLNSFERSESLLRKCLPLLRRVHGERSQEVARASADLGAVLLQTNELLGAESALLESIQIEREVGSDLPTRAMHNLAAVYRRRGETERVEQIYREILSYRRSYYEHQEDRRRLVGSLRALAAVLLDQGKLEESRSLLNEALDTLEAMIGRVDDLAHDDQEFVDVRATLGRVLQEQGQTAQAIELFDQVKKIRTARLGVSDRQVGLINRDLASAHLDLGNLDLAGELLADSRRILEGSETLPSPEVAEVDSLMGLLALRQGQSERARELLQSARDYLASERPGTRQSRLAEERWQSFSGGSEAAGAEDGAVSEAD